MLDNFLKEKFPKDKIQDWIRDPITKSFLDYLVVTGEDKIFGAVMNVTQETVSQQCFEAKGFYEALEEIKMSLEDLNQEKKPKSE